MPEADTWKGIENLENSKEWVEKFEKKYGEVQRLCKFKSKSFKIKESKDFKKKELPGRYMAKLVYGWNDRNFEEEYLIN